MDESQIEKMLEACLELLEDVDHPFTAWEVTFIEDVEEANETGHLSDFQVEKLEQIYEERCL